MNTICLRKNKDILILQLRDARLEFNTINELKGYLFKLANHGHQKIVLDFSKIERIDSSGVGVFISVWKNFGGKIKIVFCNLQPHVEQVFHLATMNKVFDIVPTERDALNVLKVTS